MAEPRLIQGLELADSDINDADSFLLRDPKSDEELNVRLYFVDAPETTSTHVGRLTKQAVAMGLTNAEALQLARRASERTRELLQSEPFEVLTRDERSTDSRRTLANIRFPRMKGTEHEFLGNILTREGLALVGGKGQHVLGESEATFRQRLMDNTPFKDEKLKTGPQFTLQELENTERFKKRYLWDKVALVDAYFSAGQNAMEGQSDPRQMAKIRDANTKAVERIVLQEIGPILGEKGLDINKVLRDYESGKPTDDSRIDIGLRLLSGRREINDAERISGTVRAFTRSHYDTRKKDKVLIEVQDLKAIAKDGNKGIIHIEADKADYIKKGAVGILAESKELEKGPLGRVVEVAADTLRGVGGGLQRSAVGTAMQLGRTVDDAIGTNIADSALLRGFEMEAQGYLDDRSARSQAERMSGEKHLGIITKGEIAPAFGQLIFGVGLAVATRGALKAASGSTAGATGAAGAVLAGQNFLEIGDQEYKEARAFGLEHDQAMATANVSAALQFPVETMSDVFLAGRFTGFSKSVINNLGLANVVRTRAAQAAAAGTVEGGTEVVQGALSNAAAKQIYDENREIFDQAQIAEEFAIGFLVGGSVAAATAPGAEVERSDGSIEYRLEASKSSDTAQSQAFAKGEEQALQEPLTDNPEMNALAIGNPDVFADPDKEAEAIKLIKENTDPEFHDDNIALLAEIQEAVAQGRQDLEKKQGIVAEDIEQTKGEIAALKETAPEPTPEAVPDAQQVPQGTPQDVAAMLAEEAEASSPAVPQETAPEAVPEPTPEAPEPAPLSKFFKDERESNAGDALDAISEDKAAPDTDRELARVLKSKLKESKAEFTTFAQRLDPGTGGSIKSGGLILNSAQEFTPEQQRHIVLHEMVHAATLQTLQSDDKTREQQEAVANLERAFNRAKEKLGTEDYAFDSVNEFAAEALTNPQLQKKLADIPYGKTTRKSGSVWDAFVDAIKRVLGAKNLSHDAMEAAMRVIDVDQGLSQIAKSQRTKRKENAFDKRMAEQEALQDYIDNQKGQPIKKAADVAKALNFNDAKVRRLFKNLGYKYQKKTGWTKGSEATPAAPQGAASKPAPAPAVKTAESQPEPITLPPIVSPGPRRVPSEVDLKAGRELADNPSVSIRQLEAAAAETPDTALPLGQAPLRASRDAALVALEVRRTRQPVLQLQPKIKEGAPLTRGIHESDQDVILRGKMPVSSIKEPKGDPTSKQKGSAKFKLTGKAAESVEQKKEFEQAVKELEAKGTGITTKSLKELLPSWSEKKLKTVLTNLGFRFDSATKQWIMSPDAVNEKFQKSIQDRKKANEIVYGQQTTRKDLAKPRRVRQTAEKIASDRVSVLNDLAVDSITMGQFLEAYDILLTEEDFEIRPLATGKRQVWAEGRQVALADNQAMAEAFIKNELRTEKFREEKDETVNQRIMRLVRTVFNNTKAKDKVRIKPTTDPDLTPRQKAVFDSANDYLNALEIHLRARFPTVEKPQDPSVSEDLTDQQQEDYRRYHGFDRQSEPQPIWAKKLWEFVDRLDAATAKGLDDLRDTVQNAALVPTITAEDIRDYWLGKKKHPGTDREGREGSLGVSDLSIREAVFNAITAIGLEQQTEGIVNTAKLIKEHWRNPEALRDALKRGDGAPPTKPQAESNNDGNGPPLGVSQLLVEDPLMHAKAERQLDYVEQLVFESMWAVAPKRRNDNVQPAADVEQKLRQQDIEHRLKHGLPPLPETDWQPEDISSGYAQTIKAGFDHALANNLSYTDLGFFNELLAREASTADVLTAFEATWKRAMEKMASASPESDVSHDDIQGSPYSAQSQAMGELYNGIRDVMTKAREGNATAKDLAEVVKRNTVNPDAVRMLDALSKTNDLESVRVRVGVPIWYDFLAYAQMKVSGPDIVLNERLTAHTAKKQVLHVITEEIIHAAAMLKGEPREAAQMVADIRKTLPISNYNIDELIQMRREGALTEDQYLLAYSVLDSQELIAHSMINPRLRRHMKKIGVSPQPMLERLFGKEVADAAEALINNHEARKTRAEAKRLREMQGTFEHEAGLPAHAVPSPFTMVRSEKQTFSQAVATDVRDLPEFLKENSHRIIADKKWGLTGLQQKIFRKKTQRIVDVLSNAHPETMNEKRRIAYRFAVLSLFSTQANPAQAHQQAIGLEAEALVETIRAKKKGPVKQLAAPLVKGLQTTRNLARALGGSSPEAGMAILEVIDGTTRGLSSLTELEYGGRNGHKARVNKFEEDLAKLEKKTKVTPEQIHLALLGNQLISMRSAKDMEAEAAERGIDVLEIEAEALSANWKSWEISNDNKDRSENFVRGRSSSQLDRQLLDKLRPLRAANNFAEAEKILRKILGRNAEAYRQGVIDQFSKLRDEFRYTTQMVRNNPWENIRDYIPLIVNDPQQNAQLGLNAQIGLGMDDLVDGAGSAGVMDKTTIDTAVNSASTLRRGLSEDTPYIYRTMNSSSITAAFQSQSYEISTLADRQLINAITRRKWSSKKDNATPRPLVDEAQKSEELWELNVSKGITELAIKNYTSDRSSVPSDIFSRTTRWSTKIGYANALTGVGQPFIQTIPGFLGWVMRSGGRKLPGFWRGMLHIRKGTAFDKMLDVHAAFFQKRSANSDSAILRRMEAHLDAEISKDDPLWEKGLSFSGRGARKAVRGLDRIADVATEVFIAAPEKALLKPLLYAEYRSRYIKRNGTRDLSKMFTEPDLKALDEALREVDDIGAHSDVAQKGSFFIPQGSGAMENVVRIVAGSFGGHINAMSNLIREGFWDMKHGETKEQRRDGALKVLSVAVQGFAYTAVAMGAAMTRPEVQKAVLQAMGKEDEEEYDKIVEKQKKLWSDWEEDPASMALSMLYNSMDDVVLPALPVVGQVFSLPLATEVANQAFDETILDPKSESTFGRNAQLYYGRKMDKVAGLLDALGPGGGIAADIWGEYGGRWDGILNSAIMAATQVMPERNIRKALQLGLIKPAERED